MVQTKTYIYLVKPGCLCVSSGCTYTKIGTIQRRLAWPLRKDDTQIREAFLILKSFGVKKYFLTPKMAKKLLFWFFWSFCYKWQSKGFPVEAFATNGNRRVFLLKLLLQTTIEGFSCWSFCYKWQPKGFPVEAFPTKVSPGVCQRRWDLLSQKWAFLTKWLKLFLQIATKGFSCWSFPHKWQSRGSDKIVEAFPTNSNQRVFRLKLSPQMAVHWVQGVGQSSWSFPHKWHSNGFSYAWNDTKFVPWAFPTNGSRMVFPTLGTIHNLFPELSPRMAVEWFPYAWNDTEKNGYA